jgi:hypothetical protein
MSDGGKGGRQRPLHSSSVRSNRKNNLNVNGGNFLFKRVNKCYQHLQALVIGICLHLLCGNVCHQIPLSS